MEGFVAIVIIAAHVQLIYTLPPSACFATFNWDDCGGPPETVFYYWKPGSRCEIGIWRGCLPNMNMFKNEYECVSKCIFTVQARASDWHMINFADETTTPTTTETTTTQAGTESTTTAGGDAGGDAEAEGGAEGDGDTKDGEAPKEGEPPEGDAEKPEGEDAPAEEAPAEEAPAEEEAAGDPEGEAE